MKINIIRSYIGIEEFKCYLLFLNIMQEFKNQDFKI
jgi:hypothetical protein